jgi:hypothetical protein
MFVFEWGTRRVRPYLTAGVGVQYSSFGGFGRSFGSTEGYITGGAGVKVYLNDNWYVAPDFRITWRR